MTCFTTNKWTKFFMSTKKKELSFFRIRIDRQINYVACFWNSGTVTSRWNKKLKTISITKHVLRSSGSGKLKIERNVWKRTKESFLVVISFCAGIKMMHRLTLRSESFQLKMQSNIIYRKAQKNNNYMKGGDIMKI